MRTTNASPRPFRSSPSRAQQTGATLVIGLILLLVLTVLGVSGMHTATMEVSMAGNTQFQSDAFQLAEDAIDIAIGTRNYTTSEFRYVVPTGDANGDRRAEIRYVNNTMVPDSLSFSGGAVEAFHFDITAVGIGGRNARATHTQSFYVIGRALP